MSGGAFRRCRQRDNGIIRRVPNRSDYHLGADVIAADGRKVGTLVRLIVNAQDFNLRALVVKEEESFAGRLLATETVFITDEVVIPIEAVRSATRESVSLSLSSHDVRRQKPY